MRALLAVFLIVALGGLTSTAYADPPDSTWIGGFWDDDDFDDVVIIIANTCAIDAPAPVDAGPVFAPVATAEPADPVDAPVFLRTSLCPRAPPVASPSHC